VAPRIPAALSFRRRMRIPGGERGEYTRNIVNNARYNAPQAHFVSYCRELRHGTAELDVRNLQSKRQREPNGR